MGFHQIVISMLKAVLEGKYTKTPFSQCQCICGFKQSEGYFLYCLWYNDPRQQNITGFIGRLVFWYSKCKAFVSFPRDNGWFFWDKSCPASPSSRDRSWWSLVWQLLFCFCGWKSLFLDNILLSCWFLQVWWCWHLDDATDSIELLLFLFKSGDYDDAIMFEYFANSKSIHFFYCSEQLITIRLKIQLIFSSFWLALYTKLI